MNRPINNNNNHEDHAEDDIGGNDDPDSPNDDSDQDSDTDTDTDAVFLDSDDAFDDDNSDEDRTSLGPVPTPEEVEVEYTYPQDFQGRTWEEVIDEFCRVRIDPSCTDIEARKFWGCPFIIELVVPKTCAVTRIQMNAFSHCNNLQRITNGLPETLLILEEYAFASCSSLHGHLVVPPNVTLLGYGCFLNCYALTSVVFQPSTSTATVVLHGSVFRYCIRLRFVRLPQTLITIPAYSFSNCHSLTDIPIPESVRKVQESSFVNCYSLRSIDLSDNIDKLGKRAFVECTSLEQIIIRSSSSNIRFGDNIFLRCSSLSTIKVYPWLFPKIFEAMNGDPSFIYKFFHKYHHQIFNERADRGVVTRLHLNGRRRRRSSRGKQKRQRQGSL